MGVVYEAVQATPIRRHVALKIIRAGFDSRQIVARFEAERQALAVMDHPNIAKIFDAGTTEQGRPYFAMELVKGPSITDYCDARKLSPRARLTLFIHVCRAVQHAHQKGVIHRDLKPSNILVTSADDEAIPKVIDFGIAKALGQDLTDESLVTEFGQIFGTPEYISPEQAEFAGQDIDTRADVYSLGVILYELLVGARPLELRDIARMAMWLAIRERTPPAPSSRLSTLPDATQEAIARDRRTDAPALRRTLRGDLDWVVMKCLEKDRARRYETANELAFDLERFLRHEPVMARPPRASYRLRKFVRRHRAGVAAAAVAILAVVSGSTAAVAGMIRAQRAEARAVAEAAAAKEVADFLQGLFEESSPTEARGNTLTAREILDRGAEKIRTELEGQPITQARLMFTMSTVYHSLGVYEEALSLLRQAIRLQERELGPVHFDLAESLSQLGVLLREQGSYEDAESAHLRSIEIRKQLFGPDHVDVANGLSDLGVVYWSRGEFESAIDVLQQAIDLREQALDPADTLVAMSVNNLAVVYQSQGRHTEAEPLHRRVLDVYRQAVGADHPYTLRALNNLGVLYSSTGEYEKADSLLRLALDTRRRVLGADHQDVALSYLVLGNLYRFQARYDEAEPLLRQSLQVLEAALGPEHAYIGSGLYGLSVVRAGQDQLREAEQFARRGLAVWQAALGPEHPDVGLAKEGLADILVRLEQAGEAERLYREAVALHEKAFGADAAAVGKTLSKYASFLRGSGRPREADSLEARAQAIRDRAQTES